MRARFSWVLFAVSGFTAVALGAFGAHGLADVLDDGAKAVYQTGVSYQFYHTLAWGIALTIAVRRPSRWLSRAETFFGVGIVLFSGSLYGLALTGLTTFGAVTPLGGVCFLVGWVMMAMAGKELSS